jgi:MFS family permease
MWRLGFFFHEMGFGLLSIFLPIYVVFIAPGNGLFYVGIMSALALFSAIPASFFWGYLCDKTRHYKRFILLSFLASTALLCFFTLTTDLGLLIVLYAVMSTFHVAHEAPKNVLIAELYSREDWEKNFAFYEGFTEVGSLIGLLLGFFMSTYGLGPINILLVCSGLNLVAFVFSLIFVRDPALIFERRLVGIEKTIDFTSHGVFLASKILDGMSVREKLKRENVTAFCVGLVLFSLATSILFTPMPIFISNVAKAALLPAGLVFAVYVLNSCGGVAGYALARNRSTQSTGKANLSRIVIFRSLLAFLLIGVLQISANVAVGLTTMILILMGFAYAIFLVSTLSLSMELIPTGKAGLFNVLIGIGGACGSFIGPFIAQASGFSNVFVIAGGIFFMAYVAFKIFS